jgi:hypothetical protein
MLFDLEILDLDLEGLTLAKTRFYCFILLYFGVALPTDLLALLFVRVVGVLLFFL